MSQTHGLWEVLEIWTMVQGETLQTAAKPHTPVAGLYLTDTRGLGESFVLEISLIHSLVRESNLNFIFALKDQEGE